MDKRVRVLNALKSKSFLKVIAGISNYDAVKVMNIVKAANRMQAHAVDICDDINIIKEALTIAEDTMICVSSVDTNKLKAAVEAGVEMIELGNFEALHEQGIFPTATEVLSWAKDMNQISASVITSVTVPGHLDINEQVNLARDLERLGVDMIQTEGASIVQSNNTGARAHIDKVSLTLANTMEIAKNTDEVFIMTASGITPDTAPLAIAAGAAGVGVGKFINKLNSSIEMMAGISSLKNALKVEELEVINHSELV